MNQYYHKKNLVDELTDEREVFNVIIQNNKYPLHWNEILDIIQYIKQASQFHGDISNSYYSAKQFIPLEKLGIDYNHLDAGGNNFLQFATYEQTRHNEKSLRIYEEGIEYILSKTNDIYNNNHYDQHLLFNMMNFISGGYKGEHFLSIVEKYPHFNLNQIDKRGKNLLNYALINNAPKVILNYLLEHNVSKNHIDKDGHTLLHSFSFLPPNNYYKTLFADMLCQNDISYDNKWHNNCIKSWIESYCDKNTNREPLHDIQWLNYTFDMILGKHYLSNNQINENIYNYLKNKQKVVFSIRKIEKDLRFDFEEKYKSVMATLHYELLNNNLPHKDDIKHKNKI